MKMKNNKKQLANLFENWEETMIYSCLQGIMGEILVDNEENPRSALARLGHFGFLAGQPNQKLIEDCKNDCQIVVPQHEGWVELLDTHYSDVAHAFTRYATKKDTVFDTNQLKKYVLALPEDFMIKVIDETIYEQCLQEEWSRDLVGNYKDVADFLKLGIGYVILFDNKIVSGASSFSTYSSGIEIEVITHPDFRQKGLAKIVSSQLILACLEKNIYPSWDAHTKTSLDLAEKLGYEFSHEYIAYYFDW